MRSIALALALLVTAAGTLPGCRSMSHGEVTGTAVGTVVGGAAGYLVGRGQDRGEEGAVIGGLAGAIGGYLIGGAAGEDRYGTRDFTYEPQPRPRPNYRGSDSGYRDPATSYSREVVERTVIHHPAPTRIVRERVIVRERPVHHTRRVVVRDRHDPYGW